jgi:DNA-binding transcriptional LysR family regulator
MENLSAMIVFARVVEARSFSTAARQLGLSKSTVSKHVSRLEDRLGARLLNRTTRRLSPTEVGLAFYERCTRIAAEVEEAEAAVTRLHSAPRGTLKVNAPMSFALAHIAPAIGQFLGEHPELTVDISMSDRFVDLIDEGFDLAVRIADLPDSSLIARRIAPNRRVACAAPAYLERHGTPTTLEELADHNCLIYTYPTPHQTWRFVRDGDEHTARVSGSFLANNGDVLLTAALDGLGIAVLPTFIVGDEIKTGRLQAVLTDYQLPETSVYAVYPHNRHLSAKVRAFVDFLSERFGPTPYWEAGI